MRHSVPACSILFGLMVALTAWSSVVSCARACSYFPAWDGLQGTPAAGAEDVPTDVVLFYAQPFLNFPDRGSVEFTLTSETGVDVSLRMRAAATLANVSYVELSPETALLPHTRYTLAAHVTSDRQGTAQVTDDRLQLRTGAGPWLGELDAPAVAVFHASIPAMVQPQCGFQSDLTCLGMEDDELFEVRRLDSLNGDLARGPTTIAALTSRATAAGGCVELRRRAPNGALGRAQILCREDGPLYHLPTFSVDGDRLLCTPGGWLLNGQPIEQTRQATPIGEWDDIKANAAAQAIAEAAGQAAAADAGVAELSQPDAALAAPSAAVDEGCSATRGSARHDALTWLVMLGMLMGRALARSQRA